MQKITPFLWFDNQAEEAANFYISIFNNSSIDSVSLCGEVGPGPKGTVMVVEFTLDGQRFMALNGGTHYTITPGISLLVNAKTQEEIDDLWVKLAAGGSNGQCGWITDKFGVTWQIVFPGIGDLLTGDAEKSKRVMDALMKMEKLDIATLEAAAEGPMRA